MKMFLRMNLQKFAEPLEDNEDIIIDEDPENVEPEEDPEPEPEEDNPEDDPEPEKDPEPESKPEPDDNTDWVKKRLARAERSFERKFLEDAASESDGVVLDRKEIPKAVRLWNLLKHNPEVSRAVDEVLQKSGEEGKLKPLSQVRPDARLNKMEADFDLREAELELKYSDPVYKKYSERIKDWAEDEGLDVSNPRTLKLALKAWKQDNAALLLAEKQKTQPKDKPREQDPTRKSAKLVGGRSPRKSQQIDYRKSSDEDILKHMGISLFTDE